MRYSNVFVASVLLLGCHAFPAQAQIIASRTALNTLLGGGGTTETFERFSVADGTATILTDANNHDLTTLDATTRASGQGPGLVVPGIAFSDSSTLPVAMQWNGSGYYGLPSRTLSGGNDLIIRFTGTDSAFGVDLLTYTGAPDTVTVTLFDTSNHQIFINASIVVSGPTPVFFGYQNTTGIGSVVLHGNTELESPVIDNLTFGNVAAVPEPGSVALLLGLTAAGAGFLSRRRHRRTPN